MNTERQMRTKTEIKRAARKALKELKEFRPVEIHIEICGPADVKDFLEVVIAGCDLPERFTAADEIYNGLEVLLQKIASGDANLVRWVSEQERRNMTAGRAAQ